MGMVAAAAFIGTAAAHWLTYMVSIRDDAERHAYLQHTGHSYWPLVWESVALCALAIGSSLWWRIRSDRALPTVGAMAWRIAAIQLFLFTAAEVTERAVAGAFASAFLASPLFWFGVAVQIVVALGLAETLRLLLAGGRLVIRALGGSKRPPSASRLFHPRTDESIFDIWSGFQAVGRAPPWGLVV